MTHLIGVYGSGGSGRGILPILRHQYPMAKLLFIDDGTNARSINGHEVLSWHSFIKRDGEKSVSLAIANSTIREKLFKQCNTEKIALIEARAQNVVEMDDVQIGEGACLSPFVTLTSNIRIGRCFHANLYSYVEHDSRIGDFVTFAPGAKCNGNVHIHDHAYIGSGAIIRQGTPEKPLTIGAGAIVGMGAVVTKDVLPNTTVVGNPARILMKD